jgi:hypothetical protein
VDIDIGFRETDVDHDVLKDQLMEISSVNFTHFLE